VKLSKNTVGDLLLFAKDHQLMGEERYYAKPLAIIHECFPTTAHRIPVCNYKDQLLYISDTCIAFFGNRQTPKAFWDEVEKYLVRSINEPANNQPPGDML
jgi:hypothetical protein